MPQGNRRGPVGMGPMTGRAAGYCAGYGMPGYANPVPVPPGHCFCRGSGRGFGRDHGRRGIFTERMPYGRGDMSPVADPISEQEKQFLQSQAEMLQTQLNEIRKRLDELET